MVPNGLALCKVHHAAFDLNIIGVRPPPDLSIEATAGAVRI
jgi:putative restriction endonuclease